jgi:hypothetical protein
MSDNYYEYTVNVTREIVHPIAERLIEGAPDSGVHKVQ